MLPLGKYSIYRWNKSTHTNFQCFYKTFTVWISVRCFYNSFAKIFLPRIFTSTTGRRAKLRSLTLKWTPFPSWQPRLTARMLVTWVWPGDLGWGTPWCSLMGGIWHVWCLCRWCTRKTMRKTKGKWLEPSALMMIPRCCTLWRRPKCRATWVLSSVCLVFKKASLLTCPRAVAYERVLYPWDMPGSKQQNAGENFPSGMIP